MKGNIYLFIISLSTYLFIGAFGLFIYLFIGASLPDPKVLTPLKVIWFCPEVITYYTCSHQHAFTGMLIIVIYVTLSVNSWWICWDGLLVVLHWVGFVDDSIADTFVWLLDIWEVCSASPSSHVLYHWVFNTMLCGCGGRATILKLWLAYLEASMPMSLNLRIKRVFVRGTPFSSWNSGLGVALLWQGRLKLRWLGIVGLLFRLQLQVLDLGQLVSLERYAD